MQIFDLSVAKTNKLLLVEGEAFCPLLVGLASITLLVLWMAGFGRFVIGEQSITPSSGPVWILCATAVDPSSPPSAP